MGKSSCSGHTTSLTILYQYIIYIKLKSEQIPGGNCGLSLEDLGDLRDALGDDTDRALDDDSRRRSDVWLSWEAELGVFFNSVLLFLASGFDACGAGSIEYFILIQAANQ